MKYILPFIFFIIPVTCSAQLFHLDGFWGLYFNDSKDVCQKKILSKYGYKADAKNSTEYSLSYRNIQFGGNVCPGIVLGFMNNKLFVGKIIITPDTQQKLLTLYESIVDDISMKYHQPNDNSYKFLYPYNGNLSDGEALIAVKGGYSDISSYWEFNNNNGYKDTIKLEVDKNGFLILTYAYGFLYAKFTQLEKERDVSAY